MSDISILAGGGGHSALAAILCEILKDYDKIIYIPSGDTISRHKLEKYGEIYELPKFIEAFGSINISKFIKSFLKSISIQKSKIVISTGSNFSLFPAISMKFKGSKLINLEVPDRIFKPSCVPKILDLFADVTVVHWREQLKNFRKSLLVGPLIYREIHSSGEKKKKILVFTGTLTFEDLLKDIKEIANNLEEYTFYIKGKISLEDKPSNVVLIEGFLDDAIIRKLLMEAALVITHPGYTMFEAISYGTPVLLYFPRKYHKHTIEDIKFLAKTFNISWFEKLSEDILIEGLKKKPSLPQKMIENAYKNFRHLVDSLLS